jgi:hypothetical protein
LRRPDFATKALISRTTGFTRAHRPRDAATDLAAVIAPPRMAGFASFTPRLKAAYTNSPSDLDFSPGGIQNFTADYADGADELAQT